MKPNISDTRLRYPSIAIFLHWTVALMVAFNLITGTLFANQILLWDAQMECHKASGALILILVAFRIIWRLTHKYPTLNGMIPQSEKILAYFGILFMYTLLLAVPVSGIMMVQSHGHNLVILGITIPRLINEAGTEIFNKMLYIHKSLAIILLTMVSGHIIAALKHHFIDKKPVLLRMLPKFANKSGKLK